MVDVRRWWERYGISTVLIALSILTGVAVRQSKAAPLSELWFMLNRPFMKADQTAAIDPNEMPRNPMLATAKVAELQQRLVELEAENRRLQSLLKLKQKYLGKGVVAPVVGRSGDHWWQQATLGLGQKDGIKEGQIAMAPGGVVGYIDSVTTHTSRVLLISDTNSQTGVLISRTRATGYMKGIRDNRAVMEFFDKVPDVRVGDAVAISHLSQKYPKGLPVGRIESVKLDKSPAPEATIELSTPINALEWVIVYPRPVLVNQAPEAKPTAPPKKKLDPRLQETGVLPPDTQEP